MKADEEKVVYSLKRLLEQEISLYSKYLELVIKERKLLSESKASELSQFSKKRLVLTESMLTSQENRLNLMRDFTPESNQHKLRDWIRISFSKSGIDTLLPLANDLHKKITEVRDLERIHSTTLNFAIKMFSGLTSIIRSATSNIVKSYGRNGKVKESYNPQARNAGVLKEV